MADRPLSVLSFQKGRQRTVGGRWSLNIREGVSASHRFHLRLPWELDAEIRNFAHQHGLGVSSAIRLLVGRGLQTEALGSSAARALLDSAAALAALTAAEHAVLMVASVLPEGQRRMRELGAQAAAAAEERIGLFKESGQ
jgi:hypothetical protein